MSTTLQISLATPRQKLFEKSCHSVVIPTTSGQIEVLPGHTALLTQCASGILRLKQSDNESGEAYRISGGFALVGPDRLAVLTETAESL